MTRRLFLILLGALAATRLAEAQPAFTGGATPPDDPLPVTLDGWMLRDGDR